ncbi:MAG: tyrosine-protein kinase family protein, partial [Ferruginibacter sp.]
EGKSFVSLNTAASISLNGDKTILLEFDLRKPRLSRALGINRQIGLSNYLAGQVNVEDIIQPVEGFKDLFLIPSGPIPPNPAEIINSPRFDTLMDYLKLNYQFVLFDSPPVSAVTDAKLLARAAHATIYIVRQNYTHISFIQLIKDLHIKKNLPNINIVFNGIKMRRGGGYGYGYGYGYNYRYGYNEDDHKDSMWKKIANKIRSVFQRQ